MAEVVGWNQERTIPEYEMMRRHLIFSDEKVRNITKMRENYQYKLSKNAKSLKDYGEYILYEKKIHSIVTAMEHSRKEKYPGLKMALSNRIVRLYREALRYFPDENRLWDAYLKFCKTNFPSEVPSAYEKLIQLQGEKPSVWVNAAMCNHELGTTPEKVKNIFFRGLQRHPDSEMLYTSFFNFLLSETAHLPPEDREASLERINAVYMTAKKKICHVQFLINLINQCDDERFQSFCKPIQKQIIADMMNLYPREEIVWDLLAQRELRGASMSEFLDETSFDMDTSDNKDSKDNKNEQKEKVAVQKRTLKGRIEMCFSVYQTAVHTLKTPLMWSLFINAMIDLNTDLSTQQVLKRKKLAIAFRGAHENNCMSEDHYFAYISLLIESKSNKDFIETVMADATERYGTLKLWEQRITFHVVENNEPKVYENFRKATRQLGLQAYPIWKLILQYYQTISDDHLERLIELFKEACSFTHAPYDNFRPLYLEWSIINQSIHNVRKLYSELKTLTPPCLELHRKMALLESQTLKPDLDKIRECYENAIALFGQTRTDVWIEFIKFERDEGEPKRVANLCERAKQTLAPEYVDNFVTEHCFLTCRS